MSERIKDIVWGILAWILGLLFIIGAIDNYFNPNYEGNKITYSLAGLVIGIFLIYSWFKQRQKK